MVLQFLAVFNFHFMRKIQKIDLIFSLLKSGIRGGEFILFQTKFCDLQTFRRRTVKLCCFSDFSYCHVVDHFLCFRLLQVLNLWLEELLHFFFIFRDWVILDQFQSPYYHSGIDESPFMCLKVKMVPLKVNPKWSKSCSI